LLEAERRAAIGQIVITVCHEINNPLSAIIGQAQLLRMQPDSSPERLQERIKVIDQCAEKIRLITEKMRNLESTRTVTYVGQTKMIDLNPEPVTQKKDKTASTAAS
jgi:signal transduction histidine kinase